MSEVKFDVTTAVSFEVRCHECGQDLDASTTTDYRGDRIVEVEPCPKCLEAKYDEGLEEGQEESA